MTLNGERGAQSIEPHTFADAEKLVQKLYQPGSPQEISRIQNALQKLQRSQQGWQFADALLQSQDEKVRFFGALTFTIKINQDWNSLSDADATLLLDRLIEWLIRLVNAGESQLVIRKLCSSLIAYYLRPAGRWKQCIRHLVLSFNEGHVIPSDTLSQGPETGPVAAKLSLPCLMATLWFAGGLVEEVGKTNTTSIQTHKYHERVSSNIGDAVAILNCSMTITPGQDVKITEESVKCFQSWVMYAHRAWIDKALELAPLRSLTPLAIQALHHENSYDVTVELFTDVLTNFSAFLTAGDLESLSTLLASTRARQIVSGLKGGDYDPEALSFARFLLAYGDATVQDLATKSEDPLLSQIVHQLLELLRCEGYAGAEDEICAQALEFWMTYTEFLIDSLFAAGEEKPAWMDSARQRVVEVIEASWVKIRIPPHEVAASWDSDARAGFKAFRADVQDLLQSSYTLLGVDVFENLARLALQSLEDRAWLHLEATLFCLNALSGSTSDEDSVDAMLSRLFGSSLFADMSSTVEPIPAKTRQTAVNMITKYTAFFERHFEYLPAMLNFLFESLKAPALASVAANAILSSCSSCRQVLIPELGAFLHQYEVLLTWATAEVYTKEKVIGGIAAIVQAIPRDEDQYGSLSTLVEFVERDVNDCIKFMEASQAEEFQASGICALKCLASMGKALRAPDNAVIDLDGDAPQSVYWAKGPGASLQAKVVQIMETVTGLMRWNSDVVEASCQILRSGYKESAPGLFVFPPKVTVDLVLASKLDTARLDYVLDTACAMLSRQVHEPESTVKSAASAFLEYLLGVIHLMGGEPSSDPEVASSGIDLADKMVPHHLDCMMNTQNIQGLFDFTLKALTAAEIMPKRAAAHFWATFVQNFEVSEEVAMFAAAVTQQYGPQLCHLLVRNIGGEAARSELDVLAEPLKKLIFAQPQAKMWLSNALSSEDFPSQKVGSTEKRIWLQKIINLRGARATNSAVKDFWIACRGAEFAYAS
ncbi:hypothetical protein HO133_000397 [Letharia lupina]|uniref:Importin N-terminal domain-containing protein n=1 Tax=Letharia lupina TaxID=560253 RepID=A0A8H6CHY6_9LECA|nr:uncharacterized protein HO133_000397 [Letharia lupina]KAF6223554.1 hypothetical protein HO133_000397 [Letharia lupina]